ncbi:MFS transporter [Staphylococcus lutrae]|nr:MFS transporter [Staphylococcus lutrae]
MPLQLIGTINIFTEVISIFLLQSLPILNHKQSKNKFSTLFNEGLQYLLKKKNLFIVLCTAIFVNFLSNSIIVGVPIIAVQQLKLTSTQFGMIEAAYTISIFLVSFILSIYPLKKDLKKYFKMSILLQFFAIFALGGFLLFPHSHMISFLFLAGVYFMIGSAMPLSNTSYFIYLQNVIEDEFKGRVFSLNQSIAQSIIPISLAFFGVILNHNAGMVFLIVSSLILLVLLIFSFLVRNYEFE